MMDVAHFLQENSIKPSYQRVRIMKYLVDHKNHPTVDMIYKELLPDIPTLSKTTIYNTLKNFVEKDIAQVLMIEENETRFDADVSNHGHFKCTRCGNIFDFKVDDNNLNFNINKKFTIDACHIYLKGICEKCNN